MPRRIGRGKAADAADVPVIVIGRNGDRKREPLQRGIGHNAAVHLAVEEVAPPPQRLRDEDIGHDAVRRPQEVDLLDEADDQPRQHAANDAARDREPAVLKIEKPCNAEIGVGETGKEARADDRRRDAHEKEQIDEVRRHVPALHQQRREKRRQDHAADDADAVPVDLQAEHDDPAIGNIKHNAG